MIRLSQQALAAATAADLIDEAVRLAAETLAADYGGFFRLLPDGRSLLLEAGSGWPEGVVGNLTISAGRTTQAGYALHGEPPVVVTDLSTETRFKDSTLRRTHHIRSGISVPIGEAGAAYGALCVFSRQPRPYTDDEVRFMQDAAALLAAVVRRSQSNEALRVSEERYRIFSELASDFTFAMHIVSGRSAHFHWVTDAFVRTTGYTLEEANRVGLGALVHPDDLPTILDILNNLPTTGSGAHEFRVFTRSGEIRWLYSHVYLPEQDTAEGYLIYGAARDITQRKEAEQALRESEGLFRTVIDALGEGVMVYDGNGSLVSINAAAERMLGVSLETLQSDPDALPIEALREDGQPLPPQELPAFIALRTGLPERGAIIGVRRKDGRVTWIQANAEPLIRPGEPRPHRVVVSFADITLLKHAEEALRASEARFRAIFRGAGIGIAVANRAGQVISANPAFQNMLGYTQRELRQMTLIDLTHPEDKDLARRSLESLLAGIYEEYQIEKRYVRANGVPLWVRLTVSLFPSPTTLDDFIIVMADDITKRKRTEEELVLRNRVIESSTVGVTITDAAIPEMPIIYVNPAFERLYGRSAYEVLGTDYHQLEGGMQTDPEAQRVIREALEKGEECQTILRLVRADGTVAWHELTLSPVHDDYGRLAYFLGIHRDITAQRQAEEAEREQRLLAEALRDTAAVLNSTLDLDEVLDGILQNLGRVMPHDIANIMLVEGGTAVIVRSLATSEAIRGWRSGEKLRIKDHPTLQMMRDTRQVVISSDAYGGASPREENLASPGAIRSYLAAPIFFEDDLIGYIRLGSAQPQGFTTAHGERLKAFVDQLALAIRNARLYEQVQRHALELEERVAERTATLNEVNKHLKALSQVKDEFVSNVSHELRTPISSIKLYHRLLRINPDKREEYMERLDRETSRLEHLVEDLLHLSRLDQRRVSFHPIVCDLNALVEMYIIDRSPLAEAQGLRLAFEQQQNLPPVEIDQVLIGQALSVLLTNALSYTPAGGQITVYTRSRQTAGQQWAGFSVRDTGPGIPPEEREHLFERFFRGKAGRESGAPGTGLGLAIAREIVALHNGEIVLEDPGGDGQGATFSVWLPAAGGGQPA
ncbi:MAG: hypothetical protein Kow00124_15930 [Anaerolineae bacterium]